jgi:hypothetical protein
LTNEKPKIFLLYCPLVKGRLYLMSLSYFGVLMLLIHKEEKQLNLINIFYLINNLSLTIFIIFSTASQYKNRASPF